MPYKKTRYETVCGNGATKSLACTLRFVLKSISGTAFNAFVTGTLASVDAICSCWTWSVIFTIGSNLKKNISVLRNSNLLHRQEQWWSLLKYFTMTVLCYIPILFALLWSVGDRKVFMQHLETHRKFNEVPPFVAEPSFLLSRSPLMYICPCKCL